MHQHLFPLGHCVHTNSFLVRLLEMRATLFEFREDLTMRLEKDGINMLVTEETMLEVGSTLKLSVMALLR